MDPSRRRAPAQFRRAPAHARGKEDHRRAGTGRAGRAHSDSAAVVGVERASRLREGISAAAVPRRLRRRQPARLEGPHHLRAGDSGCRRNRRARRACAGSACSDLQAALVAIDPQSGNMLAMVGRLGLRRRRRSTAPCAASVSRARRSSRSSMRRRSRAACRRSRTITGLRQVAVQAPEGVWIPRDERATGQDSMTLREALLESNNAAAVLLQQRVGIATGTAGWPRTWASPNSPTCRRWHLAAGWSARSI